MATPIPAIEDRARLGIGLMLLAWLMFSLVDTGAKWVAVLGFAAAQIAFFRYAGHFVVATALMARDPDGFRIPPCNLRTSRPPQVYRTPVMSGEQVSPWSISTTPPSGMHRWRRRLKPLSR